MPPWQAMVAAGVPRSSSLDLPDPLLQLPPRLPGGGRLAPLPPAGLAGGPHRLQLRGTDEGLPQLTAFPPEAAVVRAVQRAAGAAAGGLAAPPPLDADHAGERLG